MLSGTSEDMAAYRDAARYRDLKRRQNRSVAPIIAVVVILVVVGIGAAFGVTMLTNQPAETAPATESGEQSQSTALTVDDRSSAGATPQTTTDQIVMTLGGDPETYVLRGEEYLEAGCHATDKVEGDVTSSVKTSGSVDTSKIGDYTITYTATNSQGASAQSQRVVHVVESFEQNAQVLPVLMYHYVYTASAPPEALDSNYLLDTDFEQQLNYLVEEDYYYPSYQELRAFVEGTHTLPAKSVILTFDDGEAGFLNYGIPLLEKYQVPATSFIVCVDEPWASSVVRDYASPQVSFQSHSYDMHHDGSSVGQGGVIHAMTQQEIFDDIRAAQRVLGTDEAFCYPYGDNNEAAWAALREAGVLCAFTVENTVVKPGDNTEALPRCRIWADMTLDGFIWTVEPS